MKNTFQKQYHDLNRLYHRQEKDYHEKILATGLSDATFWVLTAIYEKDQITTQKELCDEWSYTKQTMNSAVSTLMQKGYILLEKAEGAKNSKSIFLTELGKTFCETRVEPILKADRKAFDVLTKEERTQFLQLMQKYILAFENQGAFPGEI